MSDAGTQEESTDGGGGGGERGGSKPGYSYGSLCKHQFRSADVVPQFTRKEPRSPLLQTTPDEELELLVKVWRMIYRFMTDTSDSRPNSKPSTKSRRQKKSNLPIMPLLRQEISKLSGAKETPTSSIVGGVASGSSESSGSKKSKPSLKKRLSLSSVNQPPEEIISVEDAAQTGFDQMQFIIGVGILKPSLRDEIFCQILRQLTNNTIKTGKSRLWMLFNLIIGIFPPSEVILPYVVSFINNGSQTGQSSSMQKLLSRVQQNGPRFQPPSTFEYTALLNKQPITLQVTLMNGTNHSVTADSCTTSVEIIRTVAEEVELEETFGFSLFIAMESKISSLGCTGDKVFDSISQCEQVYQSSAPGMTSESAPWRLFIRKEMFSPWDDITGRPVATNLVYSQIVRGIMLGEYVCDRDGDLAAVAAMQYYVEFECDVSEDNLYSSLPYYVPAHKLTGEDSIRVWSKQVAKFLNKMIVVYAKSDENYGSRSVEAVKAELVTWAKRKWSKAFSRYFDVKRLEGPRWSTDCLILGINSKGISLTTVTGDVGMDASYPQIASVMGDKDDPGLKSLSGSVIIFVFANGTLIKFDSADASDIYRLITTNMAGLLQRSTWAVAKQEFQDLTSQYLSCIEGDLIQLRHPAKDEALTSQDCQCINMATEEQGKMQIKLLHILPCIEEPADDILRLFRSPNYYAKRATEKRQQSQKSLAEVYGEGDEGSKKSELMDDDEEGEEEKENEEKEEEEEKENGSELQPQEPPKSEESNLVQEEMEMNHDEASSIKPDEVIDEAVDERKNNDVAQTMATDLENFNDSESSSIGFDKDFFNALSLFQKGLDKDEDRTSETPQVSFSYA